MLKTAFKRQNLRDSPSTLYVALQRLLFRSSIVYTVYGSAVFGTLRYWAE